MEENYIYIPEGWKIYKFGQIVTKVRNGFSGEQIDFITSFPVTRIETISNGDINLEKVGYVKNIPNSFRLISGDILLSNINSLKHIGKLAFVEEDLNLFHGMNLLILQFSNEIHKKFIYYYLSSKKQWFEKVATQAINQASINQSTLNTLNLVLPISITEQYSIANILSKVDEAIVHTEALIAKYTRIKNGLMQDLLTKGIDENGKIRNEKTHEFKDSPLGRIPKEWEVEIINNIYELRSGITPLRSNKKYFSDDGYNWVKTLDLNEDYLYTTEEKISQLALDSISIQLMPINSILLAMYGGWEQIGRTSILKKEGATNQAITCLFNPRIEMNADFIQLVLQQYRYKWKQYAVSTRKDPNITKTDIKNFVLAFPLDLKEQNRIADKIIKEKEFISLLKIELSKLQSLKRGLMQDLLTGKVRVKI